MRQKFDSGPLASGQSVEWNPGVFSGLTKDEKLFDLSDPVAIEANRRGEITQAQRNLVKGARLNFTWWLGTALLGGPLASVAWMYIAGTYLSEYIFTIILIIPLLLFSAICAPLSVYLYRFYLKRRMAQGNIEQVQGEVARAGRRYIARSEGRRLWMVDVTYPLPLEGRYLFFVLGGTSRLLSAESLDGSEPGLMDLQASEKLMLELSRANHFSLDELTINREGHLSERQRKRLFLASVKCCAGGLLAIVSLVLSVYLLAVVQLIQSV